MNLIKTGLQYSYLKIGYCSHCMRQYGLYFLRKDHFLTMGNKNETLPCGCRMTLHDEMVIKRAIYRMIRVHHEIGMFANFLIRKALLNNVCLALLDLLDNLEFEFYEYKEDNSSSRCRFYKPMPYISDTMLLYRNSMSPIHKHKPYLFIAGIKSFYK